MSGSAHSEVELAPNPEEDKFWISFAQSLISNTLDVLDTRAQFMITTAASLLVVDFAALLVTSKIAPLRISPQLFFAFSALSFMFSLFPRRSSVNPWEIEKTKEAYQQIIKSKYLAHVLGFSLFFVGLILIAVTSLI